MLSFRLVASRRRTCGHACLACLCPPSSFEWGPGLRGKSQLSYATRCLTERQTRQTRLRHHDVHASRGKGALREERERSCSLATPPAQFPLLPLPPPRRCLPRHAVRAGRGVAQLLTRPGGPTTCSYTANRSPLALLQPAHPPIILVNDDTNVSWLRPPIAVSGDQDDCRGRGVDRRGLRSVLDARRSAHLNEALLCGVSSMLTGGAIGTCEGQRGRGRRLLDTGLCAATA